ncbi:hypothetical protein GCM10007877_35500 [Marinibactrum halimedae]|uniref:Uncharacterized protein n=2 Tax=Marinibactrum halimedae TaxID=1444977 RepID=A0AA37WQ94_9GAMM|nr:hypothetical protein GCM10007877_35500 [Marinibactrum halimedae]
MPESSQQSRQASQQSSQQRSHQTTSGDASSTHRRRASESEHSTTDPWSSPDQYPLCSVPQYMSTPAPLSSQEGDTEPPRLSSELAPGTSEESQSTDSETAASETTPLEATNSGNTSSSSETSSSGEGGESVSEGAPEGGVYDEQSQMCLPEADSESSAMEGQGERETGESSSGADSNTRAGGAQKKATLPPEVIARTGQIRAPRVPYAPAAAIKRRAQIQQQTGDTPEMHHAKIQVAVLRVVEAARDGQRQIVWRVGNLARDTKKSFEEIAQEILAFTGSCVARIRNAVTQAKTDLTTAVDQQLEHISDMGTVEDDFLQTSRTEAQDQVMYELVEPGTELETAHLTLQAEFEPYLSEAKNNIRSLETNGAAFTVNPPEGTGALPADPNAPPQTSDPANGPQQIMPDAKTDLDGEVTAKANRDALGAWYAHRIQPVLDSSYTRRHGELTDNLNSQADALDSYQSEFSRAAMSLSTPMAESFRQRQEQAEGQLEVQITDDRHNLAVSLGEHGETLITKFDGVIAYLDEDLQPKLIQGMQKAGNQAARAFRDQGATSERMMNNTAAALAAAYPELVARVAEMLPEGQFLNERELGPRLKAAWESALRLPDQQFAQMLTQAETTLAQARESASKQMVSLGETADKSIQQVTDTVVASQFDFETFGFQVTGVMREGGWAAVDNARGYALRMAENILSTRDEENGALDRLLRNFVINLNRNIGQASRRYFSGVESFKDGMNSGADSVFSRVEAECDGILSPKAQTLDEELTAPDPDVTTGLVILNVASLGLTTSVTVGYLAYSDADDDDIFAALGDLRWPSQPALKFYFEGSAHANKGDLFGRFRECLSSDAYQRATGLFSANSETRFNARRDSIRDSLGLVFGLDADARRALTQGMDETERAAAGDAQIDALVAEINDSWSAFFQRGTERRMDEGYLRGDMGMVLSARMEQDLATARSRGSDDIFQSVERIEQMAREELQRGQSSLMIKNEDIQALTDQAIMDFAERHRPRSGAQGTTADGSTPAEDQSLTLEQAREIYLNRALADRVVATGETVQHVPVDQRVQDYARTVIREGWQSENALAAKQAYEFSRAEGSTFGPSETDTNRVTRSFVDPELSDMERQIREHPERADQLQPRLEELRQRQEERMARVARRLDPTLTDDDLARAGGATQYMAQRSARMFSGGEEYETGTASGDRRTHAQEDAQYGYELITEGRASLTAGIRMATRGAGTNEDLLRMTYQNRSKAEVAQARTDWNDRYGEDLDEYLGIQHRSRAEEARIAADPLYGWLQGGEVSGDLANDIQILARGNPETDQDHIELAILRYQQQRRRGTGGLARITMSGTDEAQTIDSHNRDMGQALLDEARRQRKQRLQDPTVSADAFPLPDRPEDVFTHDGRINPQVAGLVFVPGPSRDGQASPPVFSGDRAHVLDQARQVSLAGDRYKSELDRQESLMLAGITALAIAATVILMACGVGVVLAGVIVALGSGLMTMAVKSGMRGERYGWEEAAVDAASTAVEVAAAGAGGAIAKGMGATAQITGPLSRMGAALQNTFGQFGGMIAREAIVGGVSSAANTAMQDDTYKDGPGNAFGRILLGGVKGGAMSAVSAGVSEAVGDRVNNRLLKGLDNLDDVSRLSGLGRALGANGRTIVKEGIAEGLGGMAGEAAGIVIEVGSGTYKGGLKDALTRMGQAGLKDMVSGAGKAGANAYGLPARRRQRFNDLMAEARRNGDLTDSDINALRLAAQSAGEPLPSRQDITQRLNADRRILAQLPPDLRRHAESLDSQSLQQLVGMMQTGTLAGTSSERRDLLASLAEANPRLAVDELLTHMEHHSQRMQSEVSSDRHSINADLSIRNTLLQDLPEPVRNALKDLPVEGLEHLPKADLLKLADTMAHGTLTHRDSDQLLQAALKQHPKLDAISFLKQLHSAVQSAQLAQSAHRRVVDQQKAELLRDVPDGDAPLFSRLLDSELTHDQFTQLKNAFEAGQLSNAQSNALFNNALKINPGLDRNDFETSLRKTLENHQHRRHQASQQRQAAREQLLKTPADDSMALRNELLAMAPAEQRHLLKDVPILVVSDADFKRYTQSDSGNAVTLIINGKPVVVLREGADPKVLREEGLHALQAQDPRWAKHIGSLEEGHLQRWDDLPVALQVALYRNKLDLEIDAHDRLVSELTDQLLKASSPEEQQQLRLELELAQRTLDNLTQRLNEVTQLSPLMQLQMQAGLLPKPQYLDQPARMFNKAQDTRDQLIARALQAGSKGKRDKTRLEAALKDIKGADLEKLAALDLDPFHVRRVLLYTQRGNLSDVLDSLHHIQATLAEAHPTLYATAMGVIIFKKHEVSALAHSLSSYLKHSDEFSLAQLATSGLTPRQIVDIMRDADSPESVFTTLKQLSELAAQIPESRRSDWTAALTKLKPKPTSLIVANLHESLLGFVSAIGGVPITGIPTTGAQAQPRIAEDVLKKLSDCLNVDAKRAGSMADTLRQLVDTASPEQLRALADNSIDSDQLSQILRSDLEPQAQIERLQQLAELSARLNDTDRTETLSRLASKNDFVELIGLLHTATEGIGDSRTINQLVATTANLTKHHIGFAKNLVTFMRLADPDTKTRLAESLSQLSPQLALSTLHAFGFAISKMADREQQRQLTNLVADTHFKQTFHEFRNALKHAVSDDMTHLLVETMLNASDGHHHLAELMAKVMKSATPAFQQQLLAINLSADVLHDVFLNSNNDTQALHYLQSMVDITQTLPASLRAQALDHLYASPDFPASVPSLVKAQSLMGNTSTFIALLQALPEHDSHTSGMSARDLVNSLNRALKSASSDQIIDFNKQLSGLSSPTERLRFIHTTLDAFNTTKLEFKKPNQTFIDQQLATLPAADAALMRKYLDLVYSNKGDWSWDHIASNLPDSKRSEIRNKAKELDLVPDIYVNPDTDYAKFDQYAIEDITLPPEYWSKSDPVQFRYLDGLIGGEKEGYTWHHHEEDGRMLLVPTGLHKIYGHKGGRSPGHWGEDGRP